MATTITTRCPSPWQTEANSLPSREREERDMGGVKVYGSEISTCTLMALLSLEEAGAAYELVPVNLFKGEHKQPPYLSRNPFGQLPAFEDGDLTLFESRAIARYVLKKHNSDLLKPENLKESALVDVWLEVEAQSYNPPVSAIVFQVKFAPFLGLPADEKVISTSLEKLEKVLDVYEARLSTSKYLAGDSFSLADLSHIPCTFYLLGTPYGSVITSRPHVKAWWESLAARPSYKKVMPGPPS